MRDAILETVVREDLLKGHLIKEGFGEGNSSGKSVLGSETVSSKDPKGWNMYVTRKVRGLMCCKQSEGEKERAVGQKGHCARSCTFCSPCKDLNFTWHELESVAKGCNQKSKLI